MEHLLEQREYEVEKLRQRLDSEKELLVRLREGCLDGVIKTTPTFYATTPFLRIKNGQPMIGWYPTEQGPVPEAIVIEKVFETDEGKLWFLRNYGLRMEDVHAQLYSHMYRRPGHP